MFIEFTTTITHRIEVGGPRGIKDISHDVNVEAGDAAVLGTDLLYAIVSAGCKATVLSIENNEGKIVEVEQDV
jgi:hypothetical protein